MSLARSGNAMCLVNAGLLSLWFEQASLVISSAGVRVGQMHQSALSAGGGGDQKEMGP